MDDRVVDQLLIRISELEKRADAQELNSELRMLAGQDDYLRDKPYEDDMVPAYGGDENYTFKFTPDADLQGGVIHPGSDGNYKMIWYKGVGKTSSDVTGWGGGAIDLSAAGTATTYVYINFDRDNETFTLATATSSGPPNGDDDEEHFYLVEINTVDNEITSWRQRQLGDIHITLFS